MYMSGLLLMQFVMEVVGSGLIPSWVKLFKICIRSCTELTPSKGTSHALEW